MAVTKALGSGHFIVSTELGSAGIVGSVMQVIYDETGRVIDILCYEGEAEAKRGVGAQSLRSGDAASRNDTESPFSITPVSQMQYQNAARDACWWTINGDRIPLHEYLPTPSPSPRPTETPTPTPSPTSSPTPTPEDTPEPTPTVSMQSPRPTLEVEPGTPLSAEEAANEGAHTYSFSVSYKNGATGPESGTISISVEFSGNQVTLTNGGQSTFYKVAENTYEAVDDTGAVVVMEFTQTGISATSWGADWTYTRAS